MSYCINPKCKYRQNSNSLEFCQTCQTPLILNHRYRVIKPLKQTQTSRATELFEVEDCENNLGEIKILKILKFSNNEDYVRLFQQEARALIWLRHPGIPKVDPDDYFITNLDYYPRQIHCLVMEKIEGQDLEEWLKSDPEITAELILDWFKQLVEILDVIHSKGLAHRDIKPANIILKPNGQLILIDFGIVGIDEWGKTLIGTPGYTAPEQIQGKAVFQSDFFALGKTLIHCLTGEHPTNFSIHPKTKKFLWRNASIPIPDYLAKVIDRLIEDNPKKRPQNTRALLKEITNFKDYPYSYLEFWVKKYSKIGCALLSAGLGLSYTWQRIESTVHIDAHLVNIGLEVYQQQREHKQYNLARIYYYLAVLINPKNPVAFYQLGLMCDDLDDIGCAQKHYQSAIEAAKKTDHEYILASASNNLSRIYLWFESDGNRAIRILDPAFQALPTIQEEYPIEAWKRLESSLYKNQGWSYQINHHLQESEKMLSKAIEKDANNASAHCLLAQTLEKKRVQSPVIQKRIEKSWENCLMIAAPLNPEVNKWKDQAFQRLYLPPLP